MCILTSIDTYIHIYIYNQKTKNKTVPAFSVELWFFVFLVSVVGWFFTDTFGGLKLDTPEKARTCRWERCFKGHGLSWGG